MNMRMRMSRSPYAWTIPVPHHRQLPMRAHPSALEWVAEYGFTSTYVEYLRDEFFYGTRVITGKVQSYSQPAFVKHTRKGGSR